MADTPCSSSTQPVDVAVTTSDISPAAATSTSPSSSSAPAGEGEAVEVHGTLHYIGTILGTLLLLGMLMAAAIWIWQDNVGSLDSEARNTLLAPDSVLTFELTARPNPSSAAPDSPRVVDGRELGDTLSRRIAELVISDESSPPVSLSTLDPATTAFAVTYTVQYRLLDGTVIDVEYIPANSSLFVLRRRNAESHREVLTRKTPGKALVQIFTLLFPNQQVEENERIQL